MSRFRQIFNQAFAVILAFLFDMTMAASIKLTSNFPNTDKYWFNSCRKFVMLLCCAVSGIKKNKKTPKDAYSN